MNPNRVEMANAIMNDPSQYKICLVCGAIVDKNSDICSDCCAYRFDEDETNVANKALDLATKPQTALSHLDIIE